MKEPKFSIVIPVFNRESFISQTVYSVLKQTYSNFEILVVDDGSTDNTAAEVKKITDERIRYIYQKNGERGAARNLGIAEAKGSHVLFLDSDDYLLPDCLLTYNQLVTQHPEIHAFALNYFFTQPNGKKVNSDVGKVDKQFIDYTDFLKGNFLACNFCFERTYIKHQFQESRKYSTMEDWIFLIQNLRHQSMFLSKEFGASMNDHEDRSMRSNHRNIVEKVNNLIQLFGSIQLLAEEEFIELKLTCIYIQSVHSYLGNRRMKALKFGLDGLIMSGQRRFLLMIIKSLIGYSLMTRIFRK